MKVQGFGCLRPMLSAATMVLLWASLLSLAEGVTVDWDEYSSPPDKILLEQCDDLAFNVMGTHNILQFSKKNRYNACMFSDAKLLRDEVTDTTVTISGEKFLKRKMHYFGSDVGDDCDQKNMKMKVEVVPKYDVLTDQTCAGGGSELLSFSGDLEKCKRGCTGKDDCMGFEYKSTTSTCTLFSKAPTGGTTMAGAACYAAQTSCPKPSYPACSMEMVMKCTVNDGSGRDCKTQETIVPEEDPNTVQIGNPCNIQLKYEYEVKIKTTEAVTVQSMIRTRKGVEPEVVARERVYDWLNVGTFPKTVIGGVTLNADSDEEVFVDFCKGGKYKTLLEGFALSDKGEVLCTARKQYKLVVKSPPA